MHTLGKLGAMARRGRATDHVRPQDTTHRRRTGLMVEEKHADPLASRTSSPPRRASSKTDSDSSDDRPLNMPRPTPGKKRPQRPTSTPKATPSPTPPIADDDSEKERPDFPQQKLGTDLLSLFRIDGQIVPRHRGRRQGRELARHKRHKPLRPHNPGMRDRPSNGNVQTGVQTPAANDQQPTSKPQQPAKEVLPISSYARRT